MTKAIHLLRVSENKRNATKPRKSAPVREYPPGYFTEPVRAWTQMRFESQIEIDPKTKRFISEFHQAERTRANSGFARVPLGLPGALAFQD